MSNDSKCPQCGAALNESAPAGLCPNCLMALNLQAETVFTGDPAAAQPPLPPAQIAPHFPQLEILECLGRGGMGVVYKARQKTLNRFVALKLLAPERVRDPKFAERFTREAQALAALNHPNIVTIYDFGQAGGFYFLLMEFVDGLNLRQLLRARKFTPEEALAIVPPLCDALQFAHDRGIVHRDIKPENLMLDKAGRVKVADFGIAKMIEPEAGRADLPVSPEVGTAPPPGPTGVVGTPSYSAPEQKTDPQRVDSRADIYSLGVVFYEMLTGELPGNRLEPPSRKVQIDVRLDEVVLRALEQNPALRYQQASEVKTMVETIVSSKRPAGSPAESSSGIGSWLTSPFSSPEVREITSHLTKGERSDLVFYGLLLGVWFVAATFGNMWLLKSIPAPGNWIVPSVIAALFLASLPGMYRMQRRFLASTAWAKERGYNFGNLKLFSFSRQNSLRALVFVGVVILLVFGQDRLFRQASGLTELTANLKEQAARTKEDSARLASQAKRSKGLTGAGFVAAFSNGTVELVLLAMDPSSNGPCWQPDGTPSKEQFPHDNGHVYSDGAEARAIAFRLHGTTSTPVLKFNRELGFLGTFTTSMGWPVPKSPDALFVERFSYPPGSLKMDVQVGVANGPWESEIALGPQGGAAEKGDAAGPWDAVVSSGDNGGSEVAVSFQYSVKQDWETRMVAVDAAGKVIALQPGNLNSIGTNLMSTMASLSRDEFDQIKEYQLQRRKRQWVEFRNVSLQPGHFTKVEVRDFGGGSQSNTAPLVYQRQTNAPAAGQGLSFGPVMERSLLFNTNGMSDAVGLESNQIVRFPTSQFPVPACILFGDDTESNAIFIGGGARTSLRPVKPQEWNTLTAARTVEMVAGKTNLIGTAMVKRADLPAACLFRTSLGYVGVLQVASLNAGENGLDLRYKLVMESSTNSLFPTEEDAQTSPPNGSKTIPLEAAKLFNQSRELIVSMVSLIHSRTKSSAIETARLTMQEEDVQRKLALLIKGTPLEEVMWNSRRTSRQMEQIDPNRDQGKWKQVQAARQMDEFNQERLMVEAGAADFIQPQANRLQFGPWIEATVLHPSAGKDCCIVFDSGRLLTPPPEILAAMPAMSKPGADIFEAMPEETGWYNFRSAAKETNAVARWIVESGVDAVGLAPRRLELFCPAGTSTPLVDPALNPAWDSQITPAWLLWSLYFDEKLRQANPTLPTTAEALTFPDDSRSSSNSICLFRTRAGRMGILQITGSADNPPGVKIRYKLVQSGGGKN